MPKCGDYLPGKMDKRVTFQGVTLTSDGQGGSAEAWADSFTLWADLQPTKGFERYQGGQTETPVTHKVTLRYNAAVTTAKRLTFNGRVFEIKERINVGEDNAFLKLLCVELT